MLSRAFLSINYHLVFLYKIKTLRMRKFGNNCNIECRIGRMYISRCISSYVCVWIKTEYYKLLYIHSFFYRCTSFSRIRSKDMSDVWIAEQLLYEADLSHRAWSRYRQLKLIMWIKIQRACLRSEARSYTLTRATQPRWNLTPLLKSVANFKRPLYLTRVCSLLPWSSKISEVILHNGSVD